MDLPLHIYFILLSLASSFLLFFKRYNAELYLKTFPLLFIVTVIVELLSYSWWRDGRNTVRLYNFFSTFEVIYYLLVFRGILQNSLLRKAILISAVIYPCLCLYNIFYVQTEGFHSMTYSLGCLLIVFCCIYFFYELFRQPKSMVLIREPAFWICTGILFFYTSSYPVFVSANLIAQLPVVNLVNLDMYISVVNVLLYSLFTIAFLCRIRAPKSM